MNARGGATLLLAVTVLAVVTAAAFGAHRSVVREWRLEGEALQGDRAAQAADSSLAWFLAGPRAGPVEGVHTVPPDLFPARSPGRQSGEVRVRYLGEAPAGRRVWKLTVEGRVQGPGGAYRQVREAYVGAGEGQEPPVLELLAWRIAR